MSLLPPPQASSWHREEETQIATPQQELNYSKANSYLIISKMIEKLEMTLKTIQIKKNKKKTQFDLSYDVAHGSEITPCNKIVKPLVV